MIELINIIAANIAKNNIVPIPFILPPSNEHNNLVNIGKPTLTNMPIVTPIDANDNFDVTDPISAQPNVSF